MSKPDWMNFGDDDEVASPPVPSSADVFTFTGDGAAPAMQANPLSAPHINNSVDAHQNNNNNNSNPTNFDSDIPLFLRDDAAALLHAGATAPNTATPAFLSGMAGVDDEHTRGPLELEPQTNTSSTAVVGGGGGNVRRPGTAGTDGQENRNAVMYADQPSAALLHFSGDSGASWSLHRVRILGKGNYGCATLYSMDEETGRGVESEGKGEDEASGGAGAAAGLPARRAVVVKDINVQTMLNPAEDMPAVLNELQVLRSAVGHPNLVQYVDALFDTRPASYPMCFILMEFAAGGDLAALMERGASVAGSSATRASSAAAVRSVSPSDVDRHSGEGMLSEDLIAAYLIQTAVALHSLHTEHGILHRDVKPHNIFLLEDGVTVRLGDFGISMRLGRVGEKAKEACGSPYFMAPEIFEEKPYDSAADVWSLGVVFYQLLSHHLPFTAGSVAALGALVRRGQFAKLSEGASSPSSPSSSSAAAAGVARAAAAYSKELRELVDSLLTTDPAARPTLRRVLRSRYVREHLHCVPVSVLEAKKPVAVVVPSSSSSTRGSSAAPGSAKGIYHTSSGAAASAAVATQFAEESLYASVFGADAVADAVARAIHPGVTPIVNRIERP